jgi:hypothetical protein
MMAHLSSLLVCVIAQIIKLDYTEMKLAVKLEQLAYKGLVNDTQKLTIKLNYDLGLLASRAVQEGRVPADRVLY